MKDQPFPTNYELRLSYFAWMSHEADLAWQELAPATLRVPTTFNKHHEIELAHKSEREQPKQAHMNPFNLLPFKFSHT